MDCLLMLTKKNEKKMNGTKICLEDCRIEELQFYKGIKYYYSYNTIDGNIYIYDTFGRYTPIDKRTLSIYFL